MMVVVITGVLASLGFAALHKHVSAAHGAEAMNMVQSIRAAQERWRSEHMMYLDVSTDSDSWYPIDPRLSVNRNKEHAFFYSPADGTHDDNDEWLLLRPTVAGSVRFGYIVNAGTALTVMTPAVAGGPAVIWPVPEDNWYVIQAIGDTDWDGKFSHYIASSLSGGIYSENDGE